MSAFGNFEIHAEPLVPILGPIPGGEHDGGFPKKGVRPCQFLMTNSAEINYRIIVNTVQYDSVCRYLLPLHVSVS
jgi:hypothetical protein